MWWESRNSRRPTADPAVAAGKWGLSGCSVGFGGSSCGTGSSRLMAADPTSTTGLGGSEGAGAFVCTPWLTRAEGVCPACRAAAPMPPPPLTPLCAGAQKRSAAATAAYMPPVKQHQPSRRAAQGAGGSNQGGWGVCCAVRQPGALRRSLRLAAWGTCFLAAPYWDQAWMKACGRGGRGQERRACGWRGARVEGYEPHPPCARPPCRQPLPVVG